MASLKAQAWKIIPEFQSLSVTRTITFYTTHLNFTIGGSHIPPSSTEPTFCSLFKGEKAAANIYFRLCNSEEFHPGAAWIAMGDEALEQFYVELKGKTEGEVEIVEEIGDQEWGYRQFTVKDCDGNKITFFRFLEGGNLGDEEAV